jgi:hypothetical protein
MISTHQSSNLLLKKATPIKFKSENTATAQNQFGIVVFDFPLLLFHEFLGIVLLEPITKL